jgi:hypothetical protein
VFELDNSAKRVAQARRENVDLVFLREILTPSQQREKLTLVIRHRALALELDELAKSVVAEWWPEALVDELDELVPRWLAAVPLKERIPLRRSTGHVERGKEHLAGLRRLLDAEELVAPIEPRQWVLGAVECGEEQLLAVFGSMCDGVAGVDGRCLGGWA